LIPPGEHGTVPYRLPPLPLPMAMAGQQCGEYQPKEAGSRHQPAVSTHAS